MDYDLMLICSPLLATGMGMRDTRLMMMGIVTETTTI